MAAVLCDLEGTLTRTCWIRSRTLETKLRRKLITCRMGQWKSQSELKKKYNDSTEELNCWTKFVFNGWFVKQDHGKTKWNGTERIEIEQYVQLKYSSSTVGETNIIVIILWYWFSLFVWSIYNVQQPRIGLSST